MPEIDPRFIQEDVPGEEDGEALQSSEEEERALQRAHHRQKIEDLTQDRAQRKRYGDRLYWLVLGWLVATGLILGLHGFEVCGFALPVAALTTLIGATTISVIGLLAIVARYLFPRR